MNFLSKLCCNAGAKLICIARENVFCGSLDNVGKRPPTALTSLVLSNGWIAVEIITHYYCLRGSDGLCGFRLFFFSVRKITHEPLHSAQWHEHVPQQSHETQRILRSKVKVTGPDFRIFYHCKIGQKSLLAR